MGTQSLAMDKHNVQGCDNRSETGEAGAERLSLTEHERAVIHLRASKGLVRALVAQAVMLGAAILVCGLWSGSAAAWSALIGGAAYLVPNSLFAVRLLIGLWGPVASNPFTFFIGEAFKLGAAVLVLGLAGWLGKGWIVWPALLTGLVFVLKGYVLLLMFRKLP